MLSNTSPPLTERYRRRLEALTAEANRFVPLYRRLWREAGLDAERLDMPADFQRLPIVHKADFRRFPLEDRLDRRFRRGALKKLSTSGSSGQPFDVYVDRASLLRRQRRTMTGLWQLGYRPGQRFLWLKRLHPGDVTRPSPLRRLARLSFLNVIQDPHAVVEQFHAQRPDVVYGQLSALVMLCEGIDSGSRPSTSLVIGFGEQLMPGSRKLVKAKLGADLSEIYGTTEAGLIAVRRPDATCYKAARPDLLLEFLPAEDAPGFERLIVTTLGGGAMPFIRYDSGDLVQRDHTRADRPIVALAGSRLDFLTMPDGRRIGPYLIDSVLCDVPGVRQYRIVQQADRTVDLHLLTEQRPAAEVVQEARAALIKVCGPQLVLRVIEPSEGPRSSVEKLRFIQSLVRPAQGGPVTAFPTPE